MRAMDRRRMLAASASALGLAATAAPADEKKEARLKGNVKHSVVFWCFNAAGEKWDVNKTCEVAKSLGRSPAQVLLRWGIQRGFVILPKSVQPSRIVENAALFDFELDAAAMRRLDALEEGLVTGWDPETQA